VRTSNNQNISRDSSKEPFEEKKILKIPRSEGEGQARINGISKKCIGCSQSGFGALPGGEIHSSKAPYNLCEKDNPDNRGVEGVVPKTSVRKKSTCRHRPREGVFEVKKDVEGKEKSSGEGHDGGRGRMNESQQYGYEENCSSPLEIKGETRPGERPGLPKKFEERFYNVKEG